MVRARRGVFFFLLVFGSAGASWADSSRRLAWWGVGRVALLRARSGRGGSSGYAARVVRLWGVWAARAGRLEDSHADRSSFSVSISPFLFWFFFSFSSGSVFGFVLKWNLLRWRFRHVLTCTLAVSLHVIKIRNIYCILFFSFENLRKLPIAH